MDADALLAACRQIVPRLLADRGWRLVQDEEVFCEEVGAEVQRRLSRLTRARPIEEVIERATINRYNHLWYACCGEDGTPRQHQAWTELHAYLFKVAMRVAEHQRELAAESLQSVLARLYDKLDRVRDPGAFMLWAANSVRREVWRQTKNAEERLEISESDLDDPRHAAHDSDVSPLERLPAPDGDPATQPRPEAEIIQLLRDVIQRCVQKLRYRLVLIRRFLEDKTVSEVAEELDTPPSNIYVITTRAREKLFDCADFWELVYSL